ncbi:hypothetical protein MTR67_003175 [Solanum verrucosum]|uniref:Integrase catalytic domain-containing protein n=1 Tax=Solanum verrucosum TaxID=315347 RepID=A0AAF0TDX4_SOLVR|nr:hypothetical protein MTR67_003175 [Solanum verrucosum]
MYYGLREVYWCNGMNEDVVEFMAKYPNCQKVKVEHKKSRGLVQDISILIWKWEDLNMDFIMGLPQTRRQFVSIWVIVDRMTKADHFLPVKTSFSVEDYARLYIREIV